MNTTERTPIRYQVAATGISCLADLYECQVFEVEGTGLDADDDAITHVKIAIAAYDEHHAFMHFDSMNLYERVEAFYLPFKTV